MTNEKSQRNRRLTPRQVLNRRARDAGKAYYAADHAWQLAWLRASPGKFRDYPMSFWGSLDEYDFSSGGPYGSAAYNASSDAGAWEMRKQIRDNPELSTAEEIASVARYDRLDAEYRAALCAAGRAGQKDSAREASEFHDPSRAARNAEAREHRAFFKDPARIIEAEQGIVRHSTRRNRRPS